MKGQKRRFRLGKSNTSTGLTDKRNGIHCLPCKTLSKLKSQVDSPIDQLQFKKNNLKTHPASHNSKTEINCVNKVSLYTHWQDFNISAYNFKFVKRGFIFWSYHDLVFHDHLQSQGRKAKVMKAIARNFWIVSNTSLFPHHTPLRFQSFSLTS